jgi:hypothetical protein
MNQKYPYLLVDLSTTVVPTAVANEQPLVSHNHINWTSCISHKRIVWCKALVVEVVLVRTISPLGTAAVTVAA